MNELQKEPRAKARGSLSAYVTLYLPCHSTANPLKYRTIYRVALRHNYQSTSSDHHPEELPNSSLS